MCLFNSSVLSLNCSNRQSDSEVLMNQERVGLIQQLAGTKHEECQCIHERLVTATKGEYIGKKRNEAQVRVNLSFELITDVADCLFVCLLAFWPTG